MQTCSKIDHICQFIVAPAQAGGHPGLAPVSSLGDNSQLRMGPCLPEGQLILSGRPAGQPKGRGDGIRGLEAPAQAGMLSPAVSGRPAIRLRLCTAAPLAPLPRLSSTATSRACEPSFAPNT